MQLRVKGVPYQDEAIDGDVSLNASGRESHLGLSGQHVLRLLRSCTSDYDGTFSLSHGYM